MPPRKRLKENATPAEARRGGRRKKQAEDQIPHVFQEMLVEAAMSQNDEVAIHRPVKRRRVSAEPPQKPDVNVDIPVSSPASSPPSSRAQQIVYDDFGSSEGDSGADFEDVPIVDHSEEDNLEQKSLQLDLSTKTLSRPTVQRRKPVSKAERDYRLNVHKAHLLLLLMNLQLRRRWCQSEEVQAILKPLISSKIRNMLHVGKDKPAYQRSHSFNKAIEEICTIWRDEFKITGPGMRSAYWKEDIDAIREVDEFDDPSDYASFLTAAGTRHGSRDLGAMLFCALLQSAAVETRLVCSLQVLPFSAVAKGQTPEKAKSEYVYRTAWPIQEFPTSTREDFTNARWRQSEYAGASAPLLKGGPVQNKIHDSPFPIFWIEVLLPTDSWIPLDPLVRKTIKKPKTGFEPSMSDHLNTMSYVIAFEDTGYAKDVTRRYAQFFNAKTRKQRVESTKHGDHWWSVTMQWFRQFKPRRLKRDITEDLELESKSQNEPMPKNISDFKDHPVFALERHLRRNEAVWPNEHRGKISAGNKDGKSEKVYDRQNVHVVRSADQWYRKGRDLKIGEQPLKRVVKQNRRGISVDEDAESDVQNGTLLYAEFQTELYVPPPVVKGRIPKNQYGNLDVYVPSMIPPGAIHLQHPEALKAATILGVHFTDAMTGFKFKGRQGTAVVNGIVAAAEYRDALVEVVEALEYERVREQEEKRSLIALATWKKFMAALRIRQRINEEHAEHGDMSEDIDRSVAKPTDSEESSMYNDSGDDVGGGFMPDADAAAGEEDGVHAVDLAKLRLDAQQAIYHEVVVVESPHNISGKQSASKLGQTVKPVPSLMPKDSLFDDDDEDELFVGGEDEEPGRFMQARDEALEGGGFVVENDGSVDGGRFLSDEDADVAGGGFFMEESTSGPEEPGINYGGQQEEINLKELAAEVAPSLEEDMPSKPHQEVADTTDQRTASTGNIDGEKVEDKEEKEDDAVSLLSHDPDDDDVEEAWTMDIDSE